MSDPYRQLAIGLLAKLAGPEAKDKPPGYFEGMADGLAMGHEVVKGNAVDPSQLITHRIKNWDDNAQMVTIEGFPFIKAVFPSKSYGKLLQVGKGIEDGEYDPHWVWEGTRKQWSDLVFDQWGDDQPFQYCDDHGQRKSKTGVCPDCIESARPVGAADGDGGE